MTQNLLLFQAKAISLQNAVPSFSLCKFSYGSWGGEMYYLRIITGLLHRCLKLGQTKKTTKRQKYSVWAHLWQVSYHKFYVPVTVPRNKFLFNKTNRRTNFSKFIFVKKLYMFRAVPLPIIRSFPLYIRHWYTRCPRRNVPDFGRVFLMLKYTDITQNTYIQSWTVTEIMAREKCGFLEGTRTVPVSWQPYPCLYLSVVSYYGNSAHTRSKLFMYFLLGNKAVQVSAWHSCHV